ncbi:MAG: hypothetical protein WAM69_02090 [Candidatus Sulfotelmatobacter sp.]
MRRIEKRWPIASDQVKAGQQEADYLFFDQEEGSADCRLLVTGNCI